MIVASKHVMSRQRRFNVLCAAVLLMMVLAIAVNEQALQLLRAHESAVSPAVSNWSEQAREISDEPEWVVMQTTYRSAGVAHAADDAPFSLTIRSDRGSPESIYLAVLPSNPSVCKFRALKPGMRVAFTYHAREGDVNGGPAAFLEPISPFAGSNISCS